MAKSPTDDLIEVSDEGLLRYQGRLFRCALGRGGIVAAKREGDGATPVGEFALRQVYYRPDRVAGLCTDLAAIALSPADGWCDDPTHRAYNRPVRRPFAAGHEALWREDQRYDLLVVLGYNDDPPVPGRGSAIFLHVAAPGYAPTAGCVALARDDLITVLADCRAGTMLRVYGPGSIRLATAPGGIG